MGPCPRRSCPRSASFLTFSLVALANNNIDQGRSHIKRIVIPVHHNGDHWFTACIEFDSLSIIIYDSWAATFNKNRRVPKESSDHWSYVKVSVLLFIMANGLLTYCHSEYDASS